MVYLLTTLHVVFCLFLILAILLQTGKGSGMGSAFGGGSSTVFGPRGPGSFIAKLTGGVATLFMVTSMVLAYVSSSKGSDLEEKAAALSDEKRAGTEVDLDDLAKQKQAQLPAEARPDAGAVPASAADAGPAAKTVRGDAAPEAR
jgi:preprotein translocase subunit SecG